MMTDKQLDFRQSYRTQVAGWYNGFVHILVIYLIGGTASYIYAQHMGTVLWWEWLTIPVMIIFFSWIFKIEKTNYYQILGVIFSLSGVVVIVTKADLDKLLNLNFNKGDLWMVVAMLSWAMYSALLRKKKLELSQISLLQTIISAGLILLLPAYLIEMSLGYRLNVHLPFILTLTYVVLFPGLASFFFWIKGISIIGSNRSGIFLHLMPIFSTVMAIQIFKEKFMAFHFIGAVLIITGVVLSSKRRNI